jgi:hypothetical protein
MTHEARIIPLDGRPHAGPHIRQWLGDSRGWWEGQTLVVETTNFNLRKETSGLYEVACHEGNYGLKGILSAARAEENE